MKKLKKIRLSNPTKKDIEELSDKQKSELFEREKYKLQEVAKKVRLLSSETKKRENALHKEKNEVLEKIREIEMIGKEDRKTLRKYKELVDRVGNISKKLKELKENASQRAQDLHQKFLQITRLIDLIEEVQMEKLMKQQKISAEQARKYFLRNRAINEKRRIKLTG